MPLRNPVVRQSVALLRTWLHNKLLTGDGTSCPVCDRHAQMYRRKITSAMAFALVKTRRHLEDNPKTKWLHVSSYLSSLPIPAAMIGAVAHCDWAKLRYWELIEEMPQVQGKPRAGYWRVTQKGKDFVDGCIAVQHYAYVINNVVVDWSTDDADIYDAIKDRFDYRELIA